MADMDKAETSPPMVIPILVISLPGSADRRESIAARLDALSLPFEFVDAVDGRRGLPEECEPLIDRSRAVSGHSYPMSDAEFGCALSHMKAYRRMIDNGIPHAMILEDDAIPQSDLPQYLEGRHFEGSDLTSLFYGRAYVKPRRAVHLFDGYKSYPCEPGIFVGGAVGYIVSLDAARHILENAVPVISVPDWPACAERFKELKRWHLVHPRLVEHAKRNTGGEPSTIGPSRRQRKRRFLGVYIPPWDRITQSWKWKLCYRLLGFRKINW